MNPAESTMTRFNASITARDPDGLAALMTEDHALVDAEENVMRGRATCLEAWRNFFAAFPTYRNEFDLVRDAGDGLVVAVGRSVCADHVDLDGPAIWTARVVGDRVAQWRVYDDTPDVRRRLGVPE